MTGERELEAGSWELEALFRVAHAFDIGDAQFEIRLSLELVLLERERQVDGGPVLVEEFGAFGGAPCDRAESPAVLAERHLEMPFLQRARSVDNLDPACVEHRPRIGH